MRPPTRPVAAAPTTLHKYWKAARIAASVPTFRLQPDKQRYATWLRHELEDAGCLFVKIGQWVSSRGDVFPRDLVDAFSLLRQDVSPMPPDDVTRILAEDGVALDQLDDRPVSSGSVAQVHRGVRDGKPVAVKVQRPDLQRELAQDLGVVRTLMAPLAWHNPKMHADALKSLEELGDTIMRETDFLEEAASMRLFRDFAADRPNVRVPDVYDATPRAIVMEYVPSAPVADPRLTPALMDLFLAQFFHLGCVHTDLHAGNLGVDAGGRLVMYDFGSVLRCPDGMRECVKRLFVGYLNRDPAVMLDYMVECDVLRSRTPLTREQRRTLEAFVQTVLEYVEATDIRAFHTGVRAIPVPASLPDVEFRPEVFMVFRSFTLLEGMCKSIDPDFVLVDAMMPFATELVMDPEMYRLKIEDDLRTAAKLFE